MNDSQQRYFVLTPDSLETLGENGLPDEIISKLQEIVNCCVSGEEEYKFLIESIIGDRDTIKYFDIIIDLAEDLFKDTFIYDEVEWIHSELFDFSDWGNKLKEANSFVSKQDKLKFWENQLQNLYNSYDYMYYQKLISRQYPLEQPSPHISTIDLSRIKNMLMKNLDTGQSGSEVNRSREAIILYTILHNCIKEFEQKVFDQLKIIRQGSEINASEKNQKIEWTQHLWILALKYWYYAKENNMQVQKAYKIACEKYTYDNKKITTLMLQSNLSKAIQNGSMTQEEVNKYDKLKKKTKKIKKT